MPSDQFVLGCWFLAMFSLGFIFGMLVFWWIVVEVRADRRLPGRRVAK
jgi:hypothetical protein